MILLILAGWLDDVVLAQERFRILTDLLSVHDLTTQDVGFKVLTGHGASIDTTTPAGKLVFGIFTPSPNSS
jgi:hypothetical protein